MASTNFSKWLGGDNFVYAPQWASGKSNDGNYKKKYGNAATRKKGRFNANPTVCAHVSCQITQRSALDKKKYNESPRPVLYSGKRASVNG